MYKILALALAQAKYLCMSSAHMSQDDKRKFLTIQTAGFPVIRLETSATDLFIPFQRQVVIEGYFMTCLQEQANLHSVSSAVKDGLQKGEKESGKERQKSQDL